MADEENLRDKMQFCKVELDLIRATLVIFWNVVGIYSLLLSNIVPFPKGMQIEET